MNTDQFAWWLHGFFEIENPTEINREQLKIIKDHLDLVFEKVTPDPYNEGLDKLDIIAKEFYKTRPSADPTRYC